MRSTCRAMIASWRFWPAPALLRSWTTAKTSARAAALAVTTAALGGARKLNVPMDLCALAESAIDRIAEADRQRPTLEDYSRLRPPKLDFKKAVAKVRETESLDGVAEAFALAAGDVRTAMAAAAERQEKAAKAVNQFVSIQDEELQMLWWLTGRRSWGYNCPFGAVPVAAKTVGIRQRTGGQHGVPTRPTVRRGITVACRLGGKRKARDHRSN